MFPAKVVGAYSSNTVGYSFPSACLTVDNFSAYCVPSGEQGLFQVHINGRVFATTQAFEDGKNPVDHFSFSVQVDALELQDIHNTVVAEVKLKHNIV